MSRFFYYLILKPVSLLPFSALYMLSDFLYLMVYKLVGFRKKVVRKNIRNAFPEKSKKECLQIEQAFFHHFMDLLLETIKLFSISSKELLAHARVVNPEVFLPYEKTNIKLVVVSGHYGNWELAAQALILQTNLRVMGIYSPLKDKFMDSKMLESRGQFGMVLVSRKIVDAAFREVTDRSAAYLFATDQAPSNERKAYWTWFLNQETPVFFGAEKYATTYDCPVFYTRISKPRRGYYEVHFELMESQSAQTSPGNITARHTRLLEADIIARPEFWLWSHRRWKRKRPQDVPIHPPINLSANS
jgi:KDO2-lipid IV(A) lauroyltransferase